MLNARILLEDLAVRQSIFLILFQPAVRLDGVRMEGNMMQTMDSICPYGNSERWLKGSCNLNVTLSKGLINGGRISSQFTRKKRQREKKKGETRRNNLLFLRSTWMGQICFALEITQFDTGQIDFEVLDWICFRLRQALNELTYLNCWFFYGDEVLYDFWLNNAQSALA